MRARSSKFVAVVLTVVLWTVQSAAARECPPREYADAERAEDAFVQDEHRAPSKATWKRLAGLIVTYQACDDGALAEGFSDSVCHWLAIHWDRVAEVIANCRNQRDGCRLALRHIDASCGADDLKAVLQHASTKCPKNATRVCSEIVAGAQAARTDSGSQP